MLIEFRVSNFRSIGKEQIISLVPATNQQDYPDNIITTGKSASLNALALYGPNSGGKSNLLKAIDLFDKLIYLSAKSNSTTKLPYDPNLLIEGFGNKPTKFEITFVIDEKRYRYGIEFDQDTIHAEWLFRKKIGREVELFVREQDVIDVSGAFDSKSKVIDTAIEATRKNALFLSVCDMFNIEEAKCIYKWFNKFINVDGLDTTREEINTINLFENDEKYKLRIIEYLRGLDFGIEGIQVHKKEFNPIDLPDHIDPSTKESLIKELTGKIGMQVNTVHKRYDQFGQIRNDRQFGLYLRGSLRVQKAFQLSGPVLYTLINGGVLIVDEIEAKLHTKITLEIVNLFLSKKTNPFRAQLIFAIMILIC
ncbi:MAG: ATP-binding protein [Saprospiraceae bacterium]